MPDPAQTCIECEWPATWFRCTQFAGTHPFCESHARAQKDFGQDGGSYFVWLTLQQLQEGEARVKAEQAAAAAEAAKAIARVRGDWTKVTCLDGQPCGQDFELIRRERTGKAPSEYQFRYRNLQYHPQTIRFRNDDNWLGKTGWTHQHLVLALINRLTALQELKPNRMRGLALDELLGALTYLTAPEDAKITGGADEVVALRAQVKELERQREVLADYVRCFGRDHNGKPSLWNKPPGEVAEAKLEAAFRVLEERT
jgi:hypothetical protein